MDQPVEVPYSMILMMADLQPTIMRDGVNDKGQHYMLQRYVSQSGDKVYDCTFIVGTQTTCVAVVVHPDAPTVEN
jgi:hypothetical protein